MKDEIMQVIITVVIIEILCLTVGSIFAMLGMFDLTTGCVMRYDLDSGNNSYTDSMNQTVVVRADGNYSATASTVNGQSVVVRDPAQYGMWRSAQLELDAGQQVNFSIDGNVSLCMSYLPASNVGSLIFDSGSNQLKDTFNPATTPIAIPRLEDSTQGPLTLVFDARVVGWRNLLEAYAGDEIEVILKDNRSSIADQNGAVKQIVETNIFTGQSFPVADCSEGKQTYSPVCGRWSLWDGTTQYSSVCSYGDWQDPTYGCTQYSYSCNCIWGFLGVNEGCDTCHGWNKCYKPVMATLPVPYLENGSATIPVSADNSLDTALSYVVTSNNLASCTSNTDFRNSVINNIFWLSGPKFWFSARDAGGLMQRFNATPTPDVAAGGGYIWAAIQDPTGDLYPDSYTGRKLISVKYSDNRTAGYLQYRFYGDVATRTGGYVLQVKHTKCARGRGEVLTDKGYANRGQILYVISDKDPNTNPNIAQAGQAVPTPNEGSTTITANQGGNLWLKVDNNFADYKDSTGEYRIMLSYGVARAVFIDNVLTPLLSTIKNRLDTAGMQIFQNLICFKQDVSGSCHNFFNYIQAILTLYILIYGLMFLSGMVKVSYQDLVIRVVKVGLVAGLISGQTFLWFNDYLFNFIVDFTDQIIANFAGFSNISAVNSAATLATDFNNVPAHNNAGAPFMFLNTIFTKVFFSKTFLVQLFAVMGIGMVGLLYFIIIGVAFVLFIIVGLRAIAVYIIAMLATAFLLSLSPIFLTFMLFQRTFYLFENWYKALFRYMMEPVILMIGVIVLTQIFTLYMDNILNYSACWKCSISFYLPFGNLLPLPGLSNMPLFCIYWFGPWGVDSVTSGQLGMDLVSMVGLIIITFAIYGYADLANQIAAKLTSAGAGSASSIGMGLDMARSMEQHGLKEFGLDNNTQAKLKQQQAQKRAGSREALKTQEKDIIKQEKELGISQPPSKMDKLKQLGSNTLKSGGNSLKSGENLLKSGANAIKSGANSIKASDEALQSAMSSSQGRGANTSSPSGSQNTSFKGSSTSTSTTTTTDKYGNTTSTSNTTRGNSNAMADPKVIAAAMGMASEALKSGEQALKTAGTGTVQSSAGGVSSNSSSTTTMNGKTISSSTTKSGEPTGSGSVRSPSGGSSFSSSTSTTTTTDRDGKTTSETKSSNTNNGTDNPKAREAAMKMAADAQNQGMKMASEALKAGEQGRRMGADALDQAKSAGAGAGQSSAGGVSFKSSSTTTMNGRTISSSTTNSGEPTGAGSVRSSSNSSSTTSTTDGYGNTRTSTSETKSGGADTMDDPKSREAGMSAARAAQKAGDQAIQSAMRTASEAQKAGGQAIESAASSTRSAMASGNNVSNPSSSGGTFKSSDSSSSTTTSTGAGSTTTTTRTGADGTTTTETTHKKDGDK